MINFREAVIGSVILVTVRAFQSPSSTVLTLPVVKPYRRKCGQTLKHRVFRRSTTVGTVTSQIRTTADAATIRLSSTGEGSDSEVLSELNALTDQFDDVTRKMENSARIYGERISSYEGKIAKLEKELMESRKKVERKDDEVARLNRMINDYEKSSSDNKTEPGKEQEILALEKVVESLRSELESALTKKKNEIESLQKELDVASKLSSSKDGKKEIELKDRTIVDLEKQVDSLKMETEALRESVPKKNFDSILMEKDGKIDKLEKELEDMGWKMKDSSREAAEELETLKNALSAKEADLDRIELELKNEVQMELDRVVSEKETIIAKLEARLTDSSTIEEEAEAMSSEIAKLGAKLAFLESEKEAVQEERQEEKERADAEISDLKMKLSTMDEGLHSWPSEKAALLREREKLNRKLASHKQEIDKATSSMWRKLTDEKNKLLRDERSSTQAMKEDIMELRETLKIYESERQSLRKLTKLAFQRIRKVFRRRKGGEV